MNFFKAWRAKNNAKKQFDDSLRDIMLQSDTSTLESDTVGCIQLEKSLMKLRLERNGALGYQPGWGLIEICILMIRASTVLLVESYLESREPARRIEKLDNLVAQNANLDLVIDQLLQRELNFARANLN